MQKIDILSFLLLLLSFKIYFISSYIILPFNFSSKYQKIIENNFFKKPSDYFQYYMNNSIYTEIKVDDKPINFLLSMDTFATYISDKIYQPKNENNQEVLINKNFTLNYINLNKVKMINDSFNFKNIAIGKKSQELKAYYNYSFFKVIKYTNDSIEKKEAVIGFNRVKGAPYMELKDTSEHWGCKYEENTNIINQLKDRKIINSPIFSIKYNDLKEKGEIIIGDYPHEYDQLHYLEKNLFMSRVTCYTCPPFNYYSSFKELIYNNESLDVRKTFQISIDHGFIEAPIKEKKYYDSFFQKYNDSCKEEKINNIYTYYCKEEAIKNFSPIVFYFVNREIYKLGLLNDFKLEFNYKDLFIKNNEDKNSNIYYFQIIFTENEDWIFGKPLFKKYRLIFDQYNKMYGIYYNIENKIEIKENNFNIIIIYWIIIIILILCLLIESYFLIKKLIIQKRSKRANELKDEYDYNSPINSSVNKNDIND